MKVDIIRLKDERLLRYKIVVYSEDGYILARNWTFSLWGARRKAKEMVNEINNPDELAYVVESYEVPE